MDDEGITLLRESLQAVFDLNVAPKARYTLLYNRGTDYLRRIKKCGDRPDEYPTEGMIEPSSEVRM